MKSKGLKSLMAVSALILSNVNIAFSQVTLPEEFTVIYNYLVNDRICPPVRTDLDLDCQSLYETPVDGCFYSLGNKRNIYNPMGIDCEECIKNNGRLKINGSYVWGLTQSNGKIYWGTINNMLCMSPTAIMGIESEFVEQYHVGKYETPCWVCGDPDGKPGDKDTEQILPPRVYDS